MKIRILQWNISFQCNPKKIAEYIARTVHGTTIVTLQEVSVTAYHEIVSALNPSDKAYSLDLRKPGKYEGRNRAMGVATLTFGGTISHRKLVSRSIFPERTLFSKIQHKGRQIAILNFHSLTGVDYKKAKSSNFASIADFISEHSDNLDFFTCDANEPKVDSLDDGKIVFWNRGDKGYNASLIFGSQKIHPLNDAYKLYLLKNGIKRRTDPLATSHINRGTPRRYDFIYCANTWDIQHIAYPYKESVNASSDHSMVIGDFSSNI